MTTEIERKWLVPSPPPAEMLGPGQALRQGYLARDGAIEVRIRVTQTGSRTATVITIKAGDGLSRAEVELAAGEQDGEALWPWTANRRIEKVRHRVPVGDRTAEVDLYAGALAGLCTVEVEFPSVADAAAFEPPSWFGEEVTGDPAWSNASLAERGAPR